MLDKCAGIDEPLAAGDAFVRFLPSVDTSVDYERRIPLERFVAKFALEVLLIGVHERMTIETVFVDERFEANIALIGRRVQVFSFVILQRKLLLKLLAAMRANIQVLVLAMSVILMLAELRLRGELFTTLVTMEQLQG